MWSDALIRAADERLHWLVADHGFKRTAHVGEWGASVEFSGERLTLNLIHGDQDHALFASIKYHSFPRKNPKGVWAVLETLGIPGGEITVQNFVWDDRVAEVVAAIAHLVRKHWETIDHDPSAEFFERLKLAEDRIARQLRKRDPYPR